MISKKILVIGAGVAGMEAAIGLKSLGYDVLLIEKSHKTGGNVANWDRLFPDFAHAHKIIQKLQDKIATLNIEVKLNTVISDAIPLSENRYDVTLNDNSRCVVDLLLITTGFELFNAERKEEYGYGIYNNVITSADLEEYLKSSSGLVIDNGNKPKRIAFIHCVGSRDEKVCNSYCSKVCCVTGVKQAIEVRQAVPDVEIFCFYIDLRMYGHNFEELYREAQEKWGVQFIRGRLSEASENQDGSIQLKAEDTLSGRPIKMTVDMMVLLAGMNPSKGTLWLTDLLKLTTAPNHFIKPIDEHMNRNKTEHPSIFIAGTSSGPMSITETIQDARAAVMQINNYLVNSLYEAEIEQD